jgi:uncharacterized membrane protein
MALLSILGVQGCTSPMGKWQPADVNDLGTIVGTRSSPTGAQAVSYQGDGPLRDLASLPGFPISAARSISSSGVIVGNAIRAGGAQRAVVWDASGAVRELALPGLGASMSAMAINSHGVIVGSAGTLAEGAPRLPEQQFEHALVYDPSMNMALELPSPEQAVRCVATAINDAGVIVGYAMLEPPQYLALKWDAVTRALSVLPGAGSGVHSQAHAINSGGVIAGSIGGVPTLWPADSAPVSLPVGSAQNGTARDINDAGVAVGQLYYPPGTPAGAASAAVPAASPPPRESRAVRWTKDGLLEELEPSSGRSEASAINNEGVIVGFDAAGAQRFE